MGMSVALYRKLERVAPDLRDALLSLFEEVERNREEAVTKHEFNELKDVVRQLAEAQLKTEVRLDNLTVKMEELAEAQKKTEARLDRLTVKVEELAEAQKRTEARVEELAEAQKRTEARVEELAEAQKRTEARVEELAEAQKRTEKEVAVLARGLKTTREQVGGLSRSMAYALENEAYRKLPAFLEANHGIRVQDRIIRADVADEEINFFARALQGDKAVVLVGESVLRLDDASKLRSLRRKLQKVGAVVAEEPLPIIVTHYAKPKVLEKAREAGILVIQSFEWD
jgi:chromosome segregation ATPase